MLGGVSVKTCLLLCRGALLLAADILKVGVPQLLEIGNRHRFREIVALNHRAVYLGQELHLLAGLDAFGYHVHIKVIREIDNGGNYRPALLGVHRVAEELLVDLYNVDRHILEHVQRGITGAEVVQGQLEAYLMQLVHYLEQLLGVFSEYALGKLQLDVLIRNIVFIDYLAQAPDIIVVI